MLVERPLSRRDEALLRGHIQGMRMAELARIYGAEDESLAAVRTRLREVREEVILRGWRRGLLEEVALLERDPHRSSRLQSFMLKAVSKILGTARCPEPDIASPVDGWAPRRAARRLREAGIATLGELAILVDAGGARWWRQVRRLGARNGRALSSLVRASPRLQRALRRSPLAPIERALLPPAFESDRALALAWVASLGDISAARDYRSEIDRFMLWTAFVLEKPLAEFGAEDAAAYLAFLGSPPADWCGPPQLRSSPHWRPIQGPRSASSRKLSGAILRAFFRWLSERGIVEANPWATHGKPGRPRKSPALPAELAA